MQDFFLRDSRQLTTTVNGIILEGLVALLKYERDGTLAKGVKLLALAYILFIYFLWGLKYYVK